MLLALSDFQLFAYCYLLPPDVTVTRRGEFSVTICSDGYVSDERLKDGASLNAT